MDQVSMNDGLDGRETVAFGLAAGEIAIVVLALTTAYAVLRSGLVGAIAWSLASLVVAGGATLAWGRLAGRPLLEWAVLLARFLVRTRHVHAGRLRGLVMQRARRVCARAVARSRRPPAGRLLRSARPSQAGTVVIPLALRAVTGHRNAAEPEGPWAAKVPLAVVRGEAAAPFVASGDRHGRSHVVSFFSLNGGTGRTTLAVELATMLAVRARAAAATGSPRYQVALLDLTERSPGVGLRLGIAPPPDGPDGAPPTASGFLLTPDRGLILGLPPVASSPLGPSRTPSPDALIEAVEDRGAAVVVVDIDCDLGTRCQQVLRRCDQVMVTVTPTAGGVLDAYRSTAVLRRMGLRDRIGYVVNRWRPGIDLGETMADLGGVITADIPDDHAMVDAENQHRIAGLDRAGPVSIAIARLATAVEEEAGLGRSSSAVPRWDSHAG